MLLATFASSWQLPSRPGSSWLPCLATLTVQYRWVAVDECMPLHIVDQKLHLAICCCCSQAFLCSSAWLPVQVGSLAMHMPIFISFTNIFTQLAAVIAPRLLLAPLYGYLDSAMQVGSLVMPCKLYDHMCIQLACGDLARRPHSL